MAIIHGEDDYGQRLIMARSAGCEVVVRIESRRFPRDKCSVGCERHALSNGDADGEMDLHTYLPGPVNVLNLLAASAAAMARGLTHEEIARGVEAIAYVPGRFQTVNCGQPFTVAVDYAHTDDALRNVTRLARQLAAPRHGRVITVFGCGGDRDRTKRPRWGARPARAATLSWPPATILDQKIPTQFSTRFFPACRQAE